MEDLDVSVETAGIDLVCARCQTLGIPTPTILFGDTYFLFTIPGKQLACCFDCMDRLQKECEPGSTQQSPF
jgi:hypothetical protein